MGDWEGVRLHVVTGKGGTGKTTVAGALALALAAGGGRVLIVEVEERQGLAQLFDVAPLSYEELRVAPAPGGGEVHALAIDAHEAMHEYLAMFYRLGRAGRALDKLGFVDFATTIAPGLRDVLVTGKTYEAARRRDSSGGFSYDAVVLDAPPTGRIARFLDVNSSVTSLARVGPINRQAAAITELIHSPRTAVHIVSLLEDMPVQETADAVDELHAAGITVGGVVVNQVREPHLRARELTAARRRRLDRDAVAEGLRAAGLADDDTVVDLLTERAREHAERAALEKKQREVLDGLDRPTYQLPRYPDGIDPTALYELAGTLADQGAA
ncbi:arsenite efflux ATP-binding protein ArsA [Haloactinopolyspora alba]|uniref:Arsenite efflux ATP-binding protein ArsA n=1 Tax=Haloactinopolyspora alba TaxID=648780 RepID=A0A2P8E7D2_9ACTN|nr:ArsA-related P-loop ATPase [Haloactinopolyspora alba]PSL05357.1 arsenite efflux ATP-binding protein ArsA [Haloactinopolyspora alba]